MLFKKVTRILGTLPVFLRRFFTARKTFEILSNSCCVLKHMNFIMIEKKQIQHLIDDFQNLAIP